MSDGALSQDEIDALLAGVDSAGGTATATAVPAGSEEDLRSFRSFLSGNIGAGSSNLSMMTGAQVTLQEPQVQYTSRDSLLEQFPDMVTAVKADFSSGFPGEHLFILPEETSKAIASLMTKDENIEMDEMAMAVIGEVISQFVGTQITDLTKKTNNQSIEAIPPEAANIKKAAAALPVGEFLTASYIMDLADGKSHRIWEIYGAAVAADISRALSGKSPAAGPAMQSGAINTAAMQGMAGMGAMQGMTGMGSAQGMAGMGGVMGNPSNVQSVQFPNLNPHAMPQEAGNINLLMDVFMEMTVELGRTRKLIKEILSMGEGTIIELDKLAGEPVDILVNQKLIAKGEVVVIDENFGVRVTEIVSPMERVNDFS